MTNTICLPLAIDKGMFYTLHEGWVLMNRDLDIKTVIEIGTEMPIKCMFQIRNLMMHDQRVGLIFNSAFETRNCGGYLLTLMQSKGLAEQYDIRLKDDFLVLFDYPNRGTLAISPMVSDDVLNIFEEQ